MTDKYRKLEIFVSRAQLQALENAASDKMRATFDEWSKVERGAAGSRVIWARYTTEAIAWAELDRALNLFERLDDDDAAEAEAEGDLADARLAEDNEILADLSSSFDLDEADAKAITEDAIERRARKVCDS